MMLGLDTKGFPVSSCFQCLVPKHCGGTVLASSGTFKMWGLIDIGRSQGRAFQDSSKEQSR